MWSLRPFANAVAEDRSGYRSGLPVAETVDSALREERAEVFEEA
jgi:hypothetical protein